MQCEPGSNQARGASTRKLENAAQTRCKHQPDVKSGASPARASGPCRARASSSKQPRAPAATASSPGPSQSAVVSSTGSRPLGRLLPGVLPLPGRPNAAGCCCITCAVAGRAAALPPADIQLCWAAAAAGFGQPAAAAGPPLSFTRLDRTARPGSAAVPATELLASPPSAAWRQPPSRASKCCATCSPAAMSCSRCRGRAAPLASPAGVRSRVKLDANMLVMLSSSAAGGSMPQATCCRRCTKAATKR